MESIVSWQPHCYSRIIPKFELRHCFPWAAAGQWLNTAGASEMAHSWRMQVSSNGQCSLRDFPLACLKMSQKNLGLFLHNPPSLPLFFHRCQTRLGVWDCPCPFLLFAFYPSQEFSSNKSLACLILHGVCFSEDPNLCVRKVEWFAQVSWGHRWDLNTCFDSKGQTQLLQHSMLSLCTGLMVALQKINSYPNTCNLWRWPYLEKGLCRYKLRILNYLCGP